MVVGGRELIDTLWNVNIRCRITAILWKIELIDTLWNVNFLGLADSFGDLRINRYIMECK